MQLYEWQKIDEENGLVMCWFTHDSLDAIKKMNLNNKIIFSFGAGMGDAWLAIRCKKLYVVERFEEWIVRASETCGKLGISNIEYLYRPCNDSSGDQDMYCELPKGVAPDVIISDDAYRYEVCVMAEKYFKDKKGGGILICDNWQQSYVFMCDKAEQLLKKYECIIFEQKDHIDNDGINKWKTAVFFIK